MTYLTEIDLCPAPPKGKPANGESADDRWRRMLAPLVDAKLRREISPFPHGEIWADIYIGLLAEHLAADAWALKHTYTEETAP